jgi:plastocyanin
MKSCTIFATLFLTIGVALALLGPAQAHPAAAAIHIAIIDFAFEPAEQTIAIGDTITWQNDGNEPHNVIDAEGGWESPTLLNGQTYAFTFATAGTYTYYCSIHSGMLGTIIVVEPQQQTPKIYIATIER